ncbi:MAG: hypothetical protein GF408_00515 [Candidatus Omnitrophica bacterium]|nr:hypothetical protein [Candidatus Omnitrophota bacterium]
MGLKKIIPISMLAAGISSMASQIIFLREFLVVFSGNEISVGMLLAAWLIWGSAGSFLFSKLQEYFRSPAMLLCGIQSLLFPVIPLTFFLIRSSKGFLAVSPGEISGYGPMALVTFSVLSISCLLFGGIFSVSCGAYSSVSRVAGERAITRMYIMEALGALIGGIGVAFLAIRVLSPAFMVLALGVLNLVLSLFVRIAAPGRSMKKGIVAGQSILLFLACGMFLFNAPGAFDKLSRDIMWSPLRPAASRDTVYGNITVTVSGEQKSFFVNGLHLYSVPDRMSAEEAVHFVLLEHPEPKRVLLVGGGMGGALAEILKHPVEKVDYVELDPGIITMAGEYLAGDALSVLNDPRVSVLNVDGRYYIKRSRKRYDCVIIDLGDPYTAQINRFYTVDFFKELRGVLAPGGIGGFRLTSSPNYISAELADYLSSIYMSLSRVFRGIMLIPGGTMHFLFSEDEAVLSPDAVKLEERRRQRGIDIAYVRSYYTFDRFSPERVSYALEVLRKRSAPMNFDFRPIGYFFATLFWNSQTSMSFLDYVMMKATRGWIWSGAAILCLFLLFFGAVNKGRTHRPVLLSVTTTGFAEIYFQVAILLAFQEIYGYVFYKVGILMASFMTGLACGAWFIEKKMPSEKYIMKALLRTQTAVCLYPLILPAVFFLLSTTSSAQLYRLGSTVIFPVMPFAAGFIGGVQFPLAGRFYFSLRKTEGRVSGITYGMDLLGAATGAFVSSALLLPLIGVYSSCLLVFLINSCAFFGIFFSIGRARRVKSAGI